MSDSSPVSHADRALERPGSPHRDQNPGHKEEATIILPLFYSEKSPWFIKHKYTLPAEVLIIFTRNSHAKARAPELGAGSLDLQMDSQSPYLFHSTESF